MDPLVQPFGYISCMMAYTHGTLGLIVSLRKAGNYHCPHMCLTRTLMEVGQVTLINTELYNSSTGIRRALAFGLSLGAIGFLAAKMPHVVFWRTVIGFCNIYSLTQRSQAERRSVFMLLALLNLAAYDGVDFIKRNFRRHYGESISKVCYIGITLLAVRIFVAKN
ncbi:GL13196 [Drosophila persimilis]|uniref:GL13196 n=1 Tax=Drosophila persimilis TaxID=7234 RepID=B4HCX1_DROPE|nr:GL13196 [Drosophila persimilis]